MKQSSLLPETCHLKPDTYQKGNILVTALLILMVMNLLGIGLANLATKEWSMATYKSVDAELFHVTDSGCTSNAKAYFSTLNSTPTAAAITAITSSLSGTAHDNLTASQLANTNISNKLTGYSFACSVTYKVSKTATSSLSSGGEVGNSGGSYSSSGNQVTKDYYKIISTGTGPKNSSKVINTIISVEY